MTWNGAGDASGDAQHGRPNGVGAQVRAEGACGREDPYNTPEDVLDPTTPIFFSGPFIQHHRLSMVQILLCLEATTPGDLYSLATRFHPSNLAASEAEYTRAHEKILPDTPLFSHVRDVSCPCVTKTLYNNMHPLSRTRIA